MQTEHEDAGLPWPPHPARIEQLERTLIDVRRRLTDQHHEPRPAQDHIPLAVGAMTSPGLRVASRHADIVAFSGLLQVRGAPAGTLTLASAAETTRRTREVRKQAAGRAYRSDALLQVIVIGQDPTAAAARLATEFRTVSTEQLLDTPFVLLARDRSHAVRLLAERHERFGFDSFTTHEPNLDALGQIIALDSSP
jgi:alkanesulfonate monooxygenase SsuD/methylene tetrahydromethanopterin reductase-like flavin-dependent oxidoreductase (luciferase family)